MSFAGAIQGSVTLLCVAPPIATVPDKVEAPSMVVASFGENSSIADSGTGSTGCVAAIATAPARLKLHLH